MRVRLLPHKPGTDQRAYVEELLRLAVGIGALALLERLALLLPQADRTAKLLLGLPAADWIRLLTLTGMFLYFFFFLFSIKDKLRNLFPSVPEARWMVTCLGAVGAFAVAYPAYLPFVHRHAPKMAEAYETGMFVIPALLLAVVAILVLRNGRAISGAVMRLFGRTPQSASAPAPHVCKNCGQLLHSAWTFCNDCGVPVDLQAALTAPEGV